MNVHEFDLGEMAAYARKQLLISKVKKALVITTIVVVAVVIGLGALATAGVISTQTNEEPKPEIPQQEEVL